MHDGLSHQDIARQRHARLIRNATIRYAATISYERTSVATPEAPQGVRLAIASLFRRAVPAGV